MEKKKLVLSSYTCLFSSLPNYITRKKGGKTIYNDKRKENKVKYTINPR